MMEYMKSKIDYECFGRENRPGSVLGKSGQQAGNGDAVNEWQDYLNNATVYQTNGEDVMPTYLQNVMPSGKAGISFDGKEDMLSTPEKANLFSESDNDFTIFVAASFADSQNPYANLMDNAHNETDQNFAVQQMGESGNKNWFYLMYQGNGRKKLDKRQRIRDREVERRVRRGDD
jgi:hypothetical protein